MAEAKIERVYEVLNVEKRRKPVLFTVRGVVVDKLLVVRAVTEIPLQGHEAENCCRQNGCDSQVAMDVQTSQVQLPSER